MYKCVSMYMYIYVYIYINEYMYTIQMYLLKIYICV